MILKKLRPACFRSPSRCYLLLLAALVPLFAASSAPAQSPQFDKPTITIDEEVTAFSFAPDGRIAYSVRRPYKTKLYDLQRDDIWIQDTNGKRRRIFQGEKFSRGTQPFSYAVESLHWSPNAHLLLVQLFTTSVVDDAGKTQDAFMLLLIDENGKEIHLGPDSVIRDAQKPAWLADGLTFTYLAEAVKPNVLFSFQYVSISSGPAGLAFEGRTFLDADSPPKSNSAVAVERDRAQNGPPRLQFLQRLAQNDAELATLDAYEGGLSISPSGKRVAYFIDKEVLEVRDVLASDHLARIRTGLGVVHWDPDDSRVLIKRATEKKSADLAWFTIPELSVPATPSNIPVSQPAPQPILGGVSFRNFAISPDGKNLGVIPTGKRNLLVFPLPR